MIEERINESNLEYIGREHLNKIQNSKKNYEKMKQRIFNEIIRLIFKKRTYMLGPEKTKTARFIATHFIDVFELLDYLLNEEKKRI